MVERGEKPIKQILILTVDICSLSAKNSARFCESEHIVVRDSTICKLLVILVQLCALEENCLIAHWNLTFNFQKTLEVLNCDVNIDI